MMPLKGKKKFSKGDVGLVNWINWGNDASYWSCVARNKHISKAYPDFCIQGWLNYHQCIIFTYPNQTIYK